MDGHIYLLREREFIKTGENIYKIGRSSCVMNRIRSYPRSSEIYLVISSFDNVEDEGKIKQLFDSKYVKRVDIGNEYYEGDVYNMEKDIMRIVKNMDYEVKVCMPINIICDSDAPETLGSKMPKHKEPEVSDDAEVSNDAEEPEHKEHEYKIPEHKEPEHKEPEHKELKIRGDTILIYVKKNPILIVKNGDYYNISKLRSNLKKLKFDNFKKWQSEYLENMRKKYGVLLIDMRGRKTFIHKKISERVFRFCKVDEKYIDELVEMENREIKCVVENGKKVMVHVKSNYFNASKFCKHEQGPLSEWLALNSTQYMLTAYSIISSIPEDEIIKIGLGYTSTDRWLPHCFANRIIQWI